MHLPTTSSGTAKHVRRSSGTDRCSHSPGQLRAGLDAHRAPEVSIRSYLLEQLAARAPVCQRLMSVPGVGAVTSMSFLAAIDDIARFQNAHAVQNHLGLTPGEHSSSDRRQRTGITKACPAALRRTLTQAACSLRRSHPKDPISLWAADIELRRGRFVATIAVADFARARARGVRARARERALCRVREASPQPRGGIGVRLAPRSDRERYRRKARPAGTRVTGSKPIRAHPAGTRPCPKRSRCETLR